MKTKTNIWKNILILSLTLGITQTYAYADEFGASVDDLINAGEKALKSLEIKNDKPNSNYQIHNQAKEKIVKYVKWREKNLLANDPWVKYLDSQGLDIENFTPRINKKIQDSKTLLKVARYLYQKQAFEPAYELLDVSANLAGSANKDFNNLIKKDEDFIDTYNQYKNEIEK